MACFVVPAIEAVVTTVATKVIEKKESNNTIKKADDKISVTTKFSDKLHWLNNMLWGGSALLAFEHIWHGEVVPWFPFLTNAVAPVNRAEMLHEMATVGTSMAVLVTAVWAVMVTVSVSLEKRSELKSDQEV